MFCLEVVFYRKVDEIVTHTVVNTETSDLFTTISTLMNDHYPAEMESVMASKILDEEENDEHNENNDTTNRH